MNINKLFEQIVALDDYVEQHNFLVETLAPQLVEELAITTTDTLEEAKKKRKKAKEKIKRYGFFYPLYPRVIKTGEQPKEEPTTPPTEPTDSGDAGAGDTGGVDEIKPQNVDNAFAFPYSLGPEQDDEFLQKEASKRTT